MVKLPNTSSIQLPWKWDALKYRAAADVADGTLKHSKIAERAQITPRQLTTWKRHAEFRSLVNGILGDLEESVSHEVVATKAGRVRVLVDMHNKLLEIIEARMVAADEERSWARGESTGLIITKESTGRVNSREAAVDTATLGRLLDIQERIAREMGQWEQNVNVRHSGRVNHVHRVPEGINNLSDEELDALEALAERAYGSDGS